MTRDQQTHQDHFDHRSAKLAGPEEQKGRREGGKNRSSKLVQSSHQSFPHGDKPGNTKRREAQEKGKEKERAGRGEEVGASISTNTG